jgi:hypothetical protein
MVILLQLSTSQECLARNQVQVANKEIRVIHLAKNTPYHLPQKTKNGKYKSYHNAKRRKTGENEETTIFHPKSNMKG